MRRLLALLALCGGCSYFTFAAPQPVFRTKEPEGAFERAVGSVRARCGGVKFVNEEGRVVVGNWQGWNTADGLYLTQCLVTVMAEDATFSNVRVTFAVRKCPLSDMADLEKVEPTCERSDTVPQQAIVQLDAIVKQVQQDVVR